MQLGCLSIMTPPLCRQQALSSGALTLEHLILLSPCSPDRPCMPNLTPSVRMWHCPLSACRACSLAHHPFGFFHPYLLNPAFKSKPDPTKSHCASGWLFPWQAPLPHSAVPLCSHTSSLCCSTLLSYFPPTGYSVPLEGFLFGKPSDGKRRLTMALSTPLEDVHVEQMEVRVSVLASPLLPGACSQSIAVSTKGAVLETCR